MTQNKLHLYITSTLLANLLIAAGLLPPAHAKSNTDVALSQDNAAKVDSTQLNQGEATSCPLTSKTQGLAPTTTKDIESQAGTQSLNSTQIGNESQALNSSELDLDSILANEFDPQQGFLLATRCCFF